MMIVPLAGLPGSGKSTIADLLAKKLGGHIVDIDPFKCQVVDPKTLSEGLDPPEVRWQYYKLALAHIFDLLDNGAKTVVVDEMFHVGCLRHRFEGAFRERSVCVKWIEIRCSDDDVRLRFAQKPRENHILSTPQLLRIREEVAQVFEPRNGEAHWRIVMNTGSLDEAVERALDWVRAY